MKKLICVLTVVVVFVAVTMVCTSENEHSSYYPYPTPTDTKKCIDVSDEDEIMNDNPISIETSSEADYIFICRNHDTSWGGEWIVERTNEEENQ